MASFSTVTLLGNVTKDPAIKDLTGGSKIANFSVGINRRWKNAAGEKQEEVSFVEVTFFGKAAEIVEKYVHKGDSVAVEGRLKQDSWEKDGVKRSKLHVIGEKLHLMPKRGEATAATETAGDDASTGGVPGGKKTEDEVPF